MHEKDEDIEDIQKLLRLKRYEQPEGGYDEYVDGFLTDFHQRQRSEFLRQSARGLFFERLSTFFEGFSMIKMAAAGGAACVACALVAPMIKGTLSPTVAQPGTPSGSVLPTTLNPQPTISVDAQGNPVVDSRNSDEAEDFEPVHFGQIREF